MGNTPSTSGQEEIIIMNDINEIVKHFTKESMIVWHDPNVYSPENTNYLEELKTLSHIQIFKDWKEASVCLKDSRVPTCQVITSGTNGELLVQEVSSLTNVSSIYIFCGNVEHHKTWAGEYTKVTCVENDFKEVLKKIKRNTITWQRTSSSLRVDLPSFAPIFDDMDLSDINYLHFYLQGLINFKNRQQAKKDFITLAKALYGSNKFIDLFEKEYNEYNLKTILNWYTKECFLYKLTNNCLRIAKSDSIQYCRLILKDLEAAIKDKYKLHSRKFAGLLYRGAYISQEEWVRIQQNISRDIEMHGFLSTTKQRKVALHFCKEDADKKAMITIIVPNAPEKGVQGFAELKEYTDFPEEDEVLFNVRSRFTVLEAISEEIEGIKMRHLVLLYGAQAMRKFTTVQKPIIKIEISNSPEIECRACKQAIIMASVSMLAVNICDNQEYVCQDCLKKYDGTSRKLFLCIFPSVHVLPNLLENDKKKKGISLEIEGTVMQNQQSLDIPFYGYRCRACSTPKPSRFYFKCLQCKEDVGVSCCNSCFFGKQDNKCIKEKHLIVAEGSPYSFWSTGLSGKELDHLKYQENQFSETNHIFQQAEIFYQTHNYAKAVEYYEKYLEKNSKSTNKHAANAYNNLALAYEGLGEYQKAVEYHFKALEIKQVVLGKKHADVATSYSNLGTTYHQLDDYQKAVEYNSKALEIRMAVLGDKHPDTAACYNNLGLAYDSLKEYEKAIEYYSKDLEIIKTVFGDNHPDNATSYNNIGLAYDSLGAFQNAVDHHLKALEIKKAAFGDKHPSTATSYNNLGLAYENLGEYPKAIEYYTKALEIKKAVFGDQHPSTITSSENLAAVKKMQSSSSNIGKRRRKKPVKDSPEKLI